MALSRKFFLLLAVLFNFSLLPHKVQATEDLEVNKRGEPQIPVVRLWSEPLFINRGEPSILKWKTKYADTCEIDQGVGSVSYKGSQKVWPTKTITYTLTGMGPGGSAEDSVTITVKNTVPVAYPQSVITNEDKSVPITLTGSDADGDALIYNVVSGPYYGSLGGTPPDLTYTPDVNMFGPDIFTFQAHDGDLDSNPATVTITVNPVNDIPSFTKGADEVVYADAGIQTVAGWATNMSIGPDNESGQILNFILSNDNSNLFSVQPDVNEITGDLTYAPAVDTSGLAVVSVTLKDDGGTENNGVDTSPTETFTITVMAVSGPPEDVEFGLANDEQQGGGGLVGDTIRILDGNNLEFRTDIRFPSPNSLGLKFSAFYNSRSEFTGALGHGWIHTYEPFFDPEFVMGSRTYIRIVDETGRSHYFEADGSDYYKGKFCERSHVKKDSGVYVWCRLDGSNYFFDIMGKLAATEDIVGNRLELAYDANDRPEKVTDVSSGRMLTFSYNTDGRLDHISGPVTDAVAGGTWVTYAYDTNQNLTSVTYADGSGFNYAYADTNDLHNLTEKKNRAGHLINTWSYDDQDRVTENFSREGRGVAINYVNEERVDVTDAYGTLRTYALSEFGGRRRVTSVIGLANAPYSESNIIGWVYDNEMRLKETKSTGGTINLYEDYDERGNPATIILAADTDEERVITYNYHPAMNVPLSRTDVSVFSPGGTKVTIWDYDKEYDSDFNETPTKLLGRIIEQGFTRDASGSVVPFEYITTYIYNVKGQILSIDGPLPGMDDSITFTYQPQTGDILMVTKPLIGNTLFSDHDEAGQVGRMTDINNLSKSFIYDAKGRITEITHTDGYTSSVLYNMAGMPDSITDEDGVTHTFEYDVDYGRLITRIDHELNYISYDYDQQGNLTAKSYYDPSDTLTNMKRYLYHDPSHGRPGLLFKEINPDDTFIEYSYSVDGNIASVTDPNGNTTFYDYDPMNRLIKVTQPENIITYYTYDVHGNLASVTDAEGHVTTYQYDDMGRLVSTTSPDTGTVTYTYDEAGNLLSRTDAKGVTVTYDYDLLNRLKSVKFPAQSGLLAYDITYTHDEGANGKGRLTGMVDPSGDITFGYDDRGRLVEKTSIIEGETYSMYRAFTPGGRRSSFTYPSGRVIDYLRTQCTCSVEGVTTIYRGEITTLLHNVSYRPFGAMSALDTGSGGNVSGEFDLSGRVKTSNPGTEKQRSYTYDNNGNLISLDTPGTPFHSRTFTYDALNRLTHAEGPYGLIDYTYDNVGNRLTRVLETETENYSYISGSNILEEITKAATVTYRHDANGNTTEMGELDLFYNQNNRLVKVEKYSDILGTYVYNGLGQRTIKDANGDKIVFHYDFDGNLIGESGPDGNFRKEYLYNGRDRLAMVDVASGEIFYFLNDRLGTPQMITNANNTVVWEGIYKPFGETLVHPNSTVVNNFRFPGQYYDEETGLHYNYHRYYNPMIGRYLRADPIGQLGGNNLYLYAYNNPKNLKDVNGLMGLAIDFGGAYTTGFGGEVNHNAKISQGALAGTGFYIGAKDDGYAELGGYTYQGEMSDVGKTIAAAVGAGANLTVYFTDAEDFFFGKLKYYNYVIGPFSLTLFEEPCEDKLVGASSSFLGRGLGWVIHAKGYVRGLMGSLQ